MNQQARRINKEIHPMKPTFLAKLGRVSKWFQKKLSSKALILMYHRVADGGVDPWYLCVAPQHFASHLDVLQKHSHPMSLKQLAEAHQEARIPDRAVVITFDDGYADNLYNAKPLLERYDIPATVFLTGGLDVQSREFWWDELFRTVVRPGTLPSSLSLSTDEVRHWELGAATTYNHKDYQCDCTHESEFSERVKFYYSVWEWLRPLPREERRRMLDEILAWAGIGSEAPPVHRILESEEVSALAEGGLVEIGAHTLSHEMLPAHTVDFQQTEIEKNKVYLENLLGQAVISFSYPFGEYSRETVSLVREAGFTCACSVIPDVVWRDSDRFLLPRFAVNDWNGEEFEKQLWCWFSGRKD
jgi:peptidoglycan/xylan/chitin deacetylase (PgdA/CDA1 family)